MALLLFLGCFMCNVLLAWATLQQPYLSKTMFSLPPKNLNKWTHSIIFEPQPQIQLTCSSYRSNVLFGFPTIHNRFSNCLKLFRSVMGRYMGSISFTVSVYTYSTDAYRSNYQ